MGALDQPAGPGPGPVAGAAGATPARVGVRRGRVGLTAVFVALGAGFASFASRVPAVQATLHLTAGTLGLALLGAAAGLVAGAPAAGWALRRADPRWVIGAGLAVFVVGLQSVDAADGARGLFAALVVTGFGGGLVDVGMNTEAAALQVRSGRPIMSRFHAGWSVGGLAGAGLGALAAGDRLPVDTHLAAAGAVVAATGALALWALGDAAAPGRGAPPAPLDAIAAPTDCSPGRLGPTRLLPVLAVLGVLAAGDFLAEGAAGDWSAVYLHSSLGAASGTAALAFAAFSLAMTAGRVVGDHLTAAVGARRLLRGAALLAGGGLAGGLLAGSRAAGLVGFGLLGAGLSVVVPILFSAAAGVGRPATSVAVVTGSAYLGLVAGPPLVGGLAELLGLPGALGVVAGVAALPAVFGGVALRGGRP
ncbi:MAG TPA: hypothetical protein VFP61_11205 [Acidimicrobiales bacterium]|nr:hypothetical protein [Acidimicrobiales bacterium]